MKMLPGNRVNDKVLTSGLDQDVIRETGNGSSYFQETTKKLMSRYRKFGSWEQVPNGSFYMQIIKELNANIDEYGDWEWLHNFTTGEKLMASEFEILSKKFAVILQSQGFGKGDRIHFCLGNNNLVFPLIGGAWILGGVVSLDDDCSLGVEDNQLEELEAKIVVCMPSNSELIKEVTKSASKTLGHDIKLLSFGRVEGLTDLLEHLDGIDESLSPIPVHFNENQIFDEDCLIVWTSGTTGRSKGVVHTHFSSWNTFGIMPEILKPNSATISTTVFFHIIGIMAPITAALKRHTYVHIADNCLKPEMMIQAILRFQPSFIVLGTHHYFALSKSDLFRNSDPRWLDCVEIIWPFGAAVPESCDKIYHAKMKNLQLTMNYYGMTETGGIAINDSAKALGYVIPGNQIKVQNLDTNMLCKPYQHGEILIKTRKSMKGYLKRPKATSAVFDNEGFLHTGDVGYYDDNGTMFFVERTKEIIRYNDHDIAPKEIENILGAHPGVKECVAFGVPNDEFMNLISAIVCLKDGWQAAKADIRTWVNCRVPVEYLQIRGPILFWDKIPRNSRGKILRREVTKWAREEQAKQRGYSPHHKSQGTTLRAACWKKDLKKWTNQKEGHCNVM